MHAVALSAIAFSGPKATSWECHEGKIFSNGIGLKDKDLNYVGSAIADCERQCDGTTCSVIVWHASDKHCHTLSGAVTHEAFVSGLKDSSDHSTCLLVGGPEPPSPSPSPPSLPPVGPGSLRFLAVGDWGEDNSGQYADAKGMETIAELIKPSFMLMLGDNFYSSGIHGDEHAARFEKTFENVYVGTALNDLTFYAIAGNHDHGGNVSAQIAYTNVSRRWTYPDWWYGQTFPVPGTDATVEVLLFDSVLGLGNSDDAEDEWGQPPGPADAPTAAKQWAWLEARMAASTADYLWVGSHYPVWSICNHGPTAQLVDLLKPKLEQYGAHYFSGHDHCEGHINEGTGVEYIVTGAGFECCYDAPNVDKVPAGSVKFFTAGAGGSAYQKLPLMMQSGFTSYYVYADHMQVVFHAHDGTVLYKTPPIKPRAKAAARK